MSILRLLSEVENVYISLMCLFVWSGLLCKGYRHLDGGVPPLRLLCFARIRCRQLRVQAAQGATAI